MDQSVQSEMTVSFIGGGNMAEALIKNISLFVKPENILVSEPIEQRRQYLISKYNINALFDTEKAVLSDYCILAVKPQTFPKITLARSVPQSTAIISIMAGTSIQTIKQQFKLSDKHHVARIMPNTPLMVGMGTSALFPNTLSSTQLENVQQWFNAGDNLMVTVDSEEKLHAITAISGCGPGYVFWFASIMEQASKNLGLDDKTSKLLVANTLKGSSQYLMSSKHSSSTLQQQVCSKGGCTEKAISMMEQFRPQLIASIEAAGERSIELSRKS